MQPVGLQDAGFTVPTLLLAGLLLALFRLPIRSILCGFFRPLLPTDPLHRPCLNQPTLAGQLKITILWFWRGHRIQ